MKGYLYDVCTWGVTIGIETESGDTELTEFVINDDCDSWDDIVWIIKVNEIKIPERYKKWWSKHE